MKSIKHHHPVVAAVTLLAALTLPRSARGETHTLYVTAYAWSDNGDGDLVAGNYNMSGYDGHAQISTTNSWDYPSSMAVPSSWFTSGNATGYFKSGDMVLVSGLGWFKVMDICGGCSTSYDGSTGNLDMWTGYANSWASSGPYEENEITDTYTVQVFHPGDSVPAALKATTAGPAWQADVWTDSTHRIGSGAPTSPGIWIDGQQVADSDSLSSGAMTPIDWADEWVDGWYGSASTRGTNTYQHGTATVQWLGDSGATQYVNSSDCSSFSNVLMSKSYGWLPPTSNSRPLAEDYYWAIRNGSHFTQITSVSSIQAGDAIAIVYGASDGTDTGHVAWVDEAPTLYNSSTSPVQYAVTIVDSSHGFHYASTVNDAGHQDTRYLGKVNGNDCTSDSQCVSAYGANAVCNTWTLASSDVCAYTGVGRGHLRLYATSSGTITGYSWATNSGSTYYPRPSPLPTQGGSFTGRDVVVGRYTP